jgi:hypothetical protein
MQTVVVAYRGLERRRRKQAVKSRRRWIRWPTRDAVCVYDWNGVGNPWKEVNV